MNNPINIEQQRLIPDEPSDNQRITNIRLQKQLQFLRHSKLQYHLDKVQSATNPHQNTKNDQSISLVSNLRLDSKHHSQSKISYRIIIEKEQLGLQSELILLIPKAYPFSEPLYFYHQNNTNNTQQQTIHSSNNQQQHQPLTQSTAKKPYQPNSLNLLQQIQKAQPISELLLWLPKYKILQLVELIAIKIKEKQSQEEVIQTHYIGKLISTLNNPLIIFVIAILLRVLVGLGSYSGKGDWPNLGDFQAHRNWMSITVNKPIQDWYYEPNQNIWWRIDYPPIAAYLSYILGSIYKYIEPQAMALQRGYESPILSTFMRMSVLVIQICMVFPALYLIANHQITSQYTITKKYSLLILTSLLLKPDLISIDHGHFQYNSLIVGLILAAFYFLMNRSYYICCILFTIAIHSKQMAVYYALAFFAGLVGRVLADYKGNRLRIITELIKFAVIVFSVSLIIWMPFILTGSAHHVLQAIFPIHRGLYQLKVQNFWCISDVLMKWQTKFSKEFLMFICFSISTLMSLPSMLTMILSSTKKTLVLGFYTIAMTFFMFSYHVHEKSILLPLAIAPLLVQYLGPQFVSSLVVSGMLGMYHLLNQDRQSLQYFVLLLFYLLFMDIFNSITCNLGKFVLESSKSKTTAQKLHQKIFNNQKTMKSNLIKYTLLAVPFLLHLGQFIIPPPQKLQYLHHLLFAFYSFCFNAYSLVICNGILIEYLLDKISGKKNQDKEN